MSGRIRTLIGIGAVVAALAACSAEDLEDALGDLAPETERADGDGPLQEEGDVTDDGGEATEDGTAPTEVDDPDGINPMPWVMAGLDQGDDPDPDALGGCDG